MVRALSFAFMAGSAHSVDTCSLFAIADDSCSQAELRCDYTKYAKMAEKALADGTCADQGYSIQTGTTTKTYPFIGDIVATTFSKGLQAEDTCPLFAIAGDSCSQAELRCDYTKYAKMAEKALADGTCADHGYSIQTGTTTKTYPFIGDIVATTFSKGLESEAPDTCPLFAIAGDSCSQAELRCDYTKYAKMAEKALADGTCADQGYSIQTGTTTKTYPFIGDIVATTFSKGLQSEAPDTCPLFAIAGDSCSQAELRCDYTKYAKMAEKALADGTCADQGYSIQTGTTTKTYPFIGDIVATTFSKGLFETKETEPCCEGDVCVAPLVKYHSVDLKHGFCGEACMDPSKFKIYKFFEKNLTLSESINPCSEEFTPFGTHYTEYNGTVTHGLPGVLTMTLDLYGPGVHSQISV